MRDLPNRPHHRWRNCSPPVILFKSNCQRISAQQILKMINKKNTDPIVVVINIKVKLRKNIMGNENKKGQNQNNQKNVTRKNKIIKYECVNSIISIPESPSPCLSPQASPGRFWTWKNNFKKRHFDNSLIMSSTQLIPWGFLTFDICLVLLKFS